MVAGLPGFQSQTAAYLDEQLKSKRDDGLSVRLGPGNKPFGVLGQACWKRKEALLAK